MPEYQYVCMYVCMYVCTYVRMYVCTYVRMYVCMYANLDHHKYEVEGGSYDECIIYFLGVIL